MRKKISYAVLAAALLVAAPAAVRAIYCNYKDNTVCLIWDVCRQILDQYPESEITEKGKDCTLTIENRQFIIRRKLAVGRTGYFVFTKILPPVKDGPAAGSGATPLIP